MVPYINRAGKFAGNSSRLNPLVGVVMALSAVAPAWGKPATAKDTLLNAVQAFRQAVRANVTAGYGIAEERTTDTQVNARGTRVRYQPERVKFWFSGNECLTKQYSLVRPPVLFQSALRKNGVLIHFRRYSMGLKLGAPQVTVGSGILPNMTNDLRPIVWTYHRITEISSVMEPDSQFFLIAARQSAATVKKEGAGIIVKFKYPPDPPNFFGEKCVIDFDLSVGGMVTSFHHMYDELDAGHKRMIEVDTIKTKWRNASGCWLPTTRTLESHYWENGKDRGFTRTNIRFIKFVLAPLHRGALSVKNLGIPEGTFVDDTVHQELYHFTTASAARMFGAVAPGPPHPQKGGK